MRYIVTIFWVFLLSLMAEFVLSSMLSVPFSFSRGLIITVAVSVLVIVLTLVMPKDNETYDFK
ncbi:Protein of uncharacterised function (DUF2929) [Listeria grayi]|uniref:YjzD family protein n=3 Tax=Listeria grayi TaxID=1641 RepID=D7UZT1_LISGR|nr:YjzD family protein [Listeria grayi]EFI82926.1 hypothetical protein HMPREF0556_11611 [Listeria grayi DSM 20601]EUJ28920.1 hypothetical protein LMUR_04735 [Listeria grayi FSL F6-1183]MBC1921371.1 YjzD family protein [Listeria grayi]STY44084.1 Protein of uncharacterised function (DUF2929) [Listeria grayi]VEI35709.1 Protein of uncharacterised function (DUF2929) [Listeria grayi]